MVSPRTGFLQRGPYGIRVHNEVNPKKTFLLSKRLSKQMATNSNTYSRLNRHLSPDTMENAIFARFTKKSNYLKAIFLSSNLVLASEMTKNR